MKNPPPSLHRFLKKSLETQRMAPGWAMAIIGPIGTLILCELSKVGPTGVGSRDSDWMCRWFLVGTFVWSKTAKKCLGAFLGEQKRPFGFVF